MKKLLVIDGNSIINRAFYGVRPLSTTAGKPTGAIFGMVNIITRQVERLQPSYVAVAFDVHAPTFRHKMYEGYKAGRHPTPEDLLAQFDDAKDVLRLLGYHVLELPGYEADDLQGTVARMAHSTDGLHSYILTGDRDLLQLVDEKITVLLATNKDTLVMDETAFREAYGIEATSFVDMKALMGDSSDNIPGVSGIGQKTAATLITNFVTLDGVYASLDDPRMSKGVREKLIRDKENAYLSRRLAEICCEAPLDCTLEQLSFNGPDRGGLYTKLCELELTSFLTRFHLSAADVRHAPPASTTSTASTHEASSVTAEAAATTPPATDYAPWCDACKEALSAASRIALMPADGGYAVSDGTRTVLIEEPDCILPLLADKELICYDIKPLVREHGSFAARYLDLLLYGYVLNPGKGAPQLASLFSAFLNENTPNCAQMFALEEVLRKEIRAIGAEQVLDELELPLLPILADMERTGLRIDRHGMREFADALAELAEELAGRIYMQAGEVFNLQSPKQLGEVLYVKLGLHPGKKTKSGFSTSAEALEELRGTSPIIEDILEYRQVTKLRSTYAAVFPELADTSERIHTEFKQAMTATGRLSSAEPNLQNIPIRTKMGRQMRRFFVAEEGYVLVDADYSQIELRLLAHVSEDYHMSEAFKNGEDIHTKTAAAVFGVPEEEVDELMRKRAKAVNFGIVYGIGGFSLAKDIGTTVAQASGYIKSYLHNYPMIDAYLERTVEEAKSCGYTTTPFGRRRYIPELNAPNAPMRAYGKRIAMNAPIQGAAADIMKLAMIRVYHRLKTDVPRARLVMQVHDELLVEARIEDVAKVKQILRQQMEQVATLTVPLTVDVTSGPNWLDQA